MIAITNYIVMIPPTNDSVEWFRSYWPSKIIFAQSLWPPPHHSPTRKNGLVRKCHSLVQHVTVLFPKFCSFRRSGRVLARSIKIIGAWLSNQPTFIGSKYPKNNFIWFWKKLHCWQRGRGCHNCVASIVVGGRVFDIAGSPPNMYIVVYINRLYKWYIRYVYI